MTWRTTWNADRALLEAIDQVLTELAEPPVDATSLVRDDDSSGEEATAPWLLHAYTEHPIDPAILSMLPEGAPAPDAAELEDRDWVAHALEGLGIVKAGPFVLFGKHDAEDAALANGLKLQIEANQAFGTGHHPTTAGCLEALAPLALPLGNVLDIGTGSGVLAIAARRLDPTCAVIATDIDERSVEIAIENTEINGVDGITYGEAAGTDSSLIQDAAPYDMVFANILAGPLKELSGDIAGVTKSGGTVILAGLLDEQKDSVVKAYEAQGFTIQSVGGTDRWPVLVLKKDSTA